MTRYQHSALEIAFLLLLSVGFALVIDAGLNHHNRFGRTTAGGTSLLTSTSGDRYETTFPNVSDKFHGHHRVPSSLLTSPVKPGSATAMLSLPVTPACGTEAPAARSVKREPELLAKTLAYGSASFADLYDRLTPGYARYKAEKGLGFGSVSAPPGTARHKFSGEAQPKLPAALLHR